MTEFSYAELIHCETAEEVRQRVREWSSSLPDDHHLIRSTILDMHANLEFRLKQILFLQLMPLLGHYADSGEEERDRRALDRGVRRMSFSSVQFVLQPILRSYGPSDADHAWAINDLRNQVAHTNVGAVTYKGRNPFEDHDCLAEVFFNYWSAVQELGKFLDRRIEGPKLIAQEHEANCKIHYDCKNGLR